MAIVDPSVILRLGSHAEKEYFEKVISFVDGYIVAANLVESTPTASASLVFRFSSRKRSIPYYLDPMTYAFGAYTDPQIRRVRSDLDWIKSDQKNGRYFKRSYKALGEILGKPFEDAISDPKNKKAAILPEDFSDDSVIHNVCESVTNYQLTRVRSIFQEVPEVKHFADSIPLPASVFAPYFYVEPSGERDWFDLNLRLMRATTGMNLPIPVHGILCMDESVLLRDDFLGYIINELPKTKITAVWLWFSKFNEDELIRADIDIVKTRSYTKLMALRNLTEKLSRSMEVFNMHGGFFSLALSKCGMKGISHGVGYGGQKDVVPVIGQGIPVVRYYLPELHRHLSVPDIERCFNSLNISEPKDFHEKICNCAICKGVVNTDVAQFRLFGEIQPPKPGKQRGTQTPAAAKRCRFHFLLSRIRERDLVKENTISHIARDLDEANQKWNSQLSIQRYCPHLEVWKEVLGAEL